MLQNYLIPLAPFLLIALNSVLCLFFFLCLENEIRLLKQRAPRPGKILNSSAQSLKDKLEELGLRVHDAEERLGIVSLPPCPKASLNLNRRTQVLRMSRRGDAAESIAASLSIPRREVELLLKVHRLVSDGSGNST